ncbi:hypothetical protein CLOM_g23350 [Closterium sp. NIES-68]|nr:hypothetical protein CLOM_g23350 [Closterium sp. NIES-68]
MDSAPLGFLDRLTRNADAEERGDEAGAEAAAPVAREVRRAEAVSFLPFPTEVVTLDRGLTLLKGKASTTMLLGTTSDLVPGKYEGGFKLWEAAVDLMEALRQEMRDGTLSFRRKRVLELGCGHGLPGILACLKGAACAHFQDFNPEVLLNLTIPNVHANLAAAATHRTHPHAHTEGSDSPSSPSSPPITPKSPLPDLRTRFFAGDWSALDGLLSLAHPPSSPLSPRPSTAAAAPLADAAAAVAATAAATTAATDATTATGTADSSPAKPHRHARVHIQPPPAGTRMPSAGATGAPSFCASPSGAAALAHEGGVSSSGGYDVILTAETVYSPHSMDKLLALVNKCLRRPHGVLYVAGKKHYFGVGGGTRQFKSLVDKEGKLHGHLLKEVADGSSNVREIWKFFYRD